MFWHRKPLFIYPLRAVAKTAVLIGGLRSRGPVRVFEDGWSEEVRVFEPQSIAATLEQLEALAGIASVTHAVIVLRREWQPRLTEADHDRLWDAFGVPSYEQILGEDGVLYATECEACDGLHIESAKFAVGDHEIDRTPCECGRRTPRLVEPAPMEVVRSVAAYAR